MKTSILAVFFLNAALAWSQTYRVDVESTEDRVNISFATKESQSSMCQKTVIDLQVSQPIEDGLTGIPTPPTGRIALKTTVLPMTACLMAFGPHRGYISLEKNQYLPGLQNGYYLLQVDGETYGYVEVREDFAKLVDLNALPQ